MKHFFLCLTIVFSLSGFSQSSIVLTNNGTASTLAPNAIINLTTAANQNYKVTLDIKNTSTTTKSYDAKRYDVSLNNGAAAYFCFAGTCYGPPTYSAGPLTLNGSQSASQLAGQYNMLVADLDEGANVGYSMVKYTFVNTNNSADSVQVTIKYNAPAGVNEIAGNLFSFNLYPNPATETACLNVSAAKATDASLTIYNALGVAVITQPVSLREGKNKIDLNVQSLPSGIYVATLKTGRAATSKQFVVR